MPKSKPKSEPRKVLLLSPFGLVDTARWPKGTAVPPTAIQPETKPPA